MFKLESVYKSPLYLNITAKPVQPVEVTMIFLVSPGINHDTVTVFVSCHFFP